MVRKRKSVLLVIIIVLGYITILSLYSREKKEADSLSNIQKWLIEREIPCELVSNLPSEMLSDMQKQMSEVNYEIGKLVVKSTDESVEIQFSIYYKDDLNYIQNYFLRKEYGSSILPAANTIECSWDIKELALESFEYICYTEDKKGLQELYRSDRAVYANLGNYQVEFPRRIGMDKTELVVVDSKFIQATPDIETFESINVEGTEENIMYCN